MTRTQNRGRESAAAATSQLLTRDMGASEAEDSDLRDQAYAVLREAFIDKRVTRRVDRVGRTGKRFKFAFGVYLRDHVALVDTVTPSPISVSSRFTAFSAVDARSYEGAFVTHNVSLAPEDAGLLTKVADVVPLGALVAHVEAKSAARARQPS